jgi:ABC-2 type transport system permease protein
VFLPSILLSGFMFPFDGMPEIAQWIGLGLPLTHFVEMVRGIMLRGADLAELMPRVYSLGAFFVVAMGAAALKFRKRLD